jgi:carbon storage regulator
MLVLTRRPGQRVMIDGRIVVTVISTKNGQVRLGIEAPPHVHILREELQDNSSVSRTLQARGGVSLAVN